MKKIMFLTLGIAAGVVLENKYGVQEKAIQGAKDLWKIIVEKAKNFKKDVEENIDDIQEEVSE